MASNLEIVFNKLFHVHPSRREMEMSKGDLRISNKKIISVYVLDKVHKLTNMH